MPTNNISLFLVNFADTLGSVENVECGVWKMQSVENVGCGKCGVWKMRSVENAGCGKFVENFSFPFQYEINK